MSETTFIDANPWIPTGQPATQIDVATLVIRDVLDPSIVETLPAEQQPEPLDYGQAAVNLPEDTNVIVARLEDAGITVVLPDTA
jgi:hypothetical protein